MADENKLKQAKTAFTTLCKMLDEKEWNYKADEENLAITCGARGEDLPMEIEIRVDPERLLVILLSDMPFKVPEDRRAQLALAVTVANYGLVDGSFDYNFLDGRILFRMTSSYRDSLVGKDMFEYMLMCSCVTIDNYNDKFLMVVKQDMQAKEIINFIK